MALLKTSKPSPASTPAFVVPGLADLDPNFAELTARSAELRSQLATLTASKRAAEAEFRAAAASAPQISAAVAELVGDPSIAAVREKRQRVIELTEAVSNHETAINVIDQRVREAKVRAERLVLTAVRPEFGRRVATLVDALAVVEKARASIEELRADLEAEDVSPGSLGGDFHFLGAYDHRVGTSFQVRRVVTEARAAGYVG